MIDENDQMLHGCTYLNGRRCPKKWGQDASNIGVLVQVVMYRKNRPKMQGGLFPSVVASKKLWGRTYYQN
jgi:hypothetical protein